jgi:glycosyltransferase involved in cell wall biosynthesis
MRVLIVHNEALGFGGAERMLGYFLEARPEAPMEVVVAAAVDSPVLKVIPPSLRWVPIPQKQRFSVRQLFRQAASIRREPELLPIDVVHAWTARDWELGALVARQLKCPAVGTLHDHPQADYISGMRQRLMRWAARLGLSEVICVSNAVREACVTAGYRTKLSVIHNGLPEPDPMPREGSRPVPRIGFLGAFAELKGLRGFFETLDRVAAGRRSGWEAWVGGAAHNDEGERLVEAVRAKYRAAPWWPAVRWAGWTARPLEFLSQIDVLVFPSTGFDSLPTVLLEAGRAGVPVVASRTGGVDEIVRHGETGFIFERGDWAKAAEFVEALLADGGKAREMGQRALARVGREFSMAKMMESHLELYRRVSADWGRSS